MSGGLSLSIGVRSTRAPHCAAISLHADIQVVEHLDMVGDEADGRDHQVALAGSAPVAARASSICGPSQGTPVCAAL